jgi:exodeoxyribonuclease X
LGAPDAAAVGRDPGGAVLRILVIDTETTGLDPEVDRVVEVAGVPVEMGASGVWSALPGASTLVNPGCKIPPEVSAVHHILDEDVARSPCLEEVLGGNLEQFGPLDAFAAHNAKFDSAFLKSHTPGLPWVCTWRCALHVWPEAPSHKNFALHYWLGGGRPIDLQPHRALCDATVTATLLTALLQERGFDELVSMSTRPVVLRTCRFGKYAGKSWSDVPTDYLQWVERQDFDADVRLTVETELKRRKA